MRRRWEVLLRRVARAKAESPTSRVSTLAVGAVVGGEFRSALVALDLERPLLGASRDFFSSCPPLHSLVICFPRQSTSGTVLRHPAQGGFFVQKIEV